jgi:thiol-disulfide isomerase/thioredoxin
MCAVGLPVFNPAETHDATKKRPTREQGEVMATSATTEQNPGSDTGEPAAQAQEPQAQETHGEQAAAQSLDGETSERDLVGIMYSERTWVVPAGVKAAAFWLGAVSLLGLGFFEVQKRSEFRGLLIDSVVEPEDWGNAKAPEIALQALYKGGKDGGGGVQLSEYAGQWVLVNFWATWCAPCRDEMPSLEMLHRRFGDRLVTLAVSIDDDPAQVARFFGNTRPSFTVLWDKEKQFTRAYGTSKYPETYLIAPDGRVAAKFTGPRDWYNQGMVQYFDDVLANRRPPVRS